MPQDALKVLYEATEEEYRQAYFAKGDRGCALWGRLISKRLLNDEVFDLPREIVKGEDLLMNIRLAFANTKYTRVEARHRETRLPPKPERAYSPLLSSVVSRARYECVENAH